MSGQQPVFGKRGARSAPPAAAVAREQPSAAHLELAAAARAAFREREAPAADTRGGSPGIADYGEDHDMRAYIGPNWGAYRPLWLKMKPAPGLRSGHSAAAALFTSLWLLYRKQYLLGASILAVQLATSWLALEWSSVFDIVLAGFFGRYGKSIVLLAGISKIEDIRAAGLPLDIAAIRIGGAGGGNPIAAMVGTLLLAGGVFGIIGPGESGPKADGLEGLRAITEQLRGAPPSN